MDELSVTGLTLRGCLPEARIERVRRDEGVVVSFGVDAVTRPRVSGRRRDHVGPHRVQLHIGTTLEQIVVFRDQETLEAILPEVAGMTAPLFVREGIAEVDPLHGLAKFFGCCGLYYQMNVVRHQAIVVECDLVLGKVRRDELPVTLEISRIMEDGRPVVTPGEDVVATAINE